MKKILLLCVTLGVLNVAGCGKDAPSKDWFKAHINEAMKTSSQCSDANYWSKNTKRCVNAKSALADNSRIKPHSYRGSGNTHDFTPHSNGQKSLTNP